MVKDFLETNPTIGNLYVNSDNNLVLYVGNFINNEIEDNNEIYDNNEVLTFFNKNEKKIDIDNIQYFFIKDNNEGPIKNYKYSSFILNEEEINGYYLDNLEDNELQNNYNLLIEKQKLQIDNLLQELFMVNNDLNLLLEIIKKIKEIVDLTVNINLEYLEKFLKLRNYRLEENVDIFIFDELYDNEVVQNEDIYIEEDNKLIKGNIIKFKLNLNEHKNKINNSDVHFIKLQLDWIYNYAKEYENINFISTEGQRILGESINTLERNISLNINVEDSNAHLEKMMEIRENLNVNDINDSIEVFFDNLKKLLIKSNIDRLSKLSIFRVFYRKKKMKKKIKTI